MQPFLDSTDALDNGAELRRRMQQDGYLFIRGLVPASALEALRLHMLERARASGWVQEGTPLPDAIADLRGFSLEPEPAYMNVYHTMYVSPEFHALQHHPHLLQFFAHLLNGPVLPHPRLIGRIIFPQKEVFTSPAHQDFIPIQGTPDTYTAWIPLAALPPEMGGLEVAEGSHQQGVYEFQPALGAGGLEITEPFEGKWRGGPFAQGDALFFHSLTPHRGAPNSSQSLRLSLDARYQHADQPIAPGSLQPHNPSSTWEEIYSDWPASADWLKYYWKQWDLDIKPYDNRYHDQRDQLAIELGQQGDVRAYSTLQRIVTRGSDPAKKQLATELLAKLDAKL
ncbi:MAG: phytanoil-CoA alpha hydroxylase [Candidatus Latescibacteria bacterium]|nr:phytanoil-CoA alpha hydroxylase [Candidatus Latescibacterota bacterium]